MLAWVFLRRSESIRVLQAARRVYKKHVKDKFPFSKEFIASFSAANPQVPENYKNFYAQLEGAQGTLQHRDFDEGFDESLFAKSLIASLADIAPGQDAADRYHKFMIGTLESLLQNS